MYQALFWSLEKCYRIRQVLLFVWASLVTQTVKNLPAVWDTWVQFLCWDDPWKRQWLPTPVFLPGEFHEERSLVGNSPWGHKESDTTDQLTQLTLLLA